MNLFQSELWILVSFAAAGFQTVRFLLQKVLSTALLTPTGATFARFVYSAPIIVVAMAGYVKISGAQVAFPSVDFWAYAVMGGLAQVLATICVVTLFKTRNFAVGITFKKTEVILSVAVGLILLGEGVSLAAFGAIALGLVGVLLLSKPPDVAGWGLGQMWNKGVALGLSAGALFAVSAVSYRGASLEIAVADPIVRAGVTLGAVTTMQMIGMGMWLWWQDRAQISAVWRVRRVAVWIGLLSLGGSFCWFLAFTLQTAAYVKAVGQVELVLSLLVSILFFSERVSWRELTGIAVLCASIVLLILVT
ncbi:EamA family transporter [Roseobacter litoralis]|uniref:EamA family transporter n=1 Tax=Roseobacter litoralis TaxID=42443 RepID=UPI002493DDC2|nr:EamA family transporter [Roseobacter litoralis]